MTTWSVVKDDTREKRRPLTYFRYLLLACVAGLVISLGVAMTPRPAPEPPEPAFSEQARASALETSLSLRSSAQLLAEAAPEAQQAAFTRVVTLLTTQAKALLPPGTATPDPSTPAKVPPSETALSATPPEPSATAAAASAGELVTGLSASGVQRTSDAVAADGGMARLLAAVGTAQLLEASALAGAVGVPAPEATVAGLTPEDAKQLKGGTPDCVASSSAAGSSAEPSAGPPAARTADSPSARSGEPGQSGVGQQGGSLLAAALSMTVKTEAETIYGYQVALTRLEKSNTQSASSLMERHEQLLQEAEELSRLHCVDAPHQEPGYSLKPEFLQAPAAGLGSLEAETLPVYADLVALSEGPARRWAIAGLWEAAQRSVQWGADPGAVPGVLFNADQLPPLPDEAAADDGLPNDDAAADHETAAEQP